MPGSERVLTTQALAFVADLQRRFGPLRSGEMAAGFVIQYLAGMLPPGQMRRRYSLAWQREFLPRMRLARFLQEVALRPRLLSPGLRLLSLAPAFGQQLIRNTRGAVQPERTGFDRVLEGVKE